MNIYEKEKTNRQKLVETTNKLGGSQPEPSENKKFRDKYMP